jgi:integrase
LSKKEIKYTKKCPKCGTPAIKGATICTECGAKLRTSKGMQRVNPVKADQIKLIRDSIRVGIRGSRNEFLFLFLMNTALRISDALTLKVSMVRNKEFLELIEQKTGKSKIFAINGFLQQIIFEYTKDMDDNDYLFVSQKLDENNNPKPISRSQAWEILSSAAKKIGIKKFACHSARKTYARLIYEKTKDLSFVMRLLNHSSEKITLRYLHLTEEADNARIMDFSLS